MTFDSVGGRAGIAFNQKSVEKAGGTWDQVLFPVTTTDFTPFAQEVAAKKPDIVVGHYGSGQNLGMIPALRRSGYNGPYVVASYGVTEDTVRQAAERAGSGQNIYYVTRYSSSFDNNPSVAGVAAAQKNRHLEAILQHACHRLGAWHVRRGCAQGLRLAVHARAARQDHSVAQG